MIKKPGLIRRFFSLVGKLVGAIRSMLNLLILLFFIAIIVSLFQEQAKPLPEKAALRLALGGVLVDQKTRMPPISQLFGEKDSIDAETVVGELIKSIKRATTDRRITALVLELDSLAGGGISKLEEIGEALQYFKGSGKPVIAVGDNFNQEQYYLASYADEIYLNPMGSVLLTGYGSYPVYLKDALDKLKVNVHVFRVGDYKDAIEPFTRNDMSPESRQHTEEWLQGLWSAYTSRIETLRNLPKDAINDYVNHLDEKLASQGGNAAKLALKSGLVDHIASRPKILERLQQLAGSDNAHSYHYIDHQQYAGISPALPTSATPEQPIIGVVVAKGVIVDGFEHNGDMGSSNFTALMQQVREKNPAALVVRIDSPGGSAFASEVIRKEIELTRSNGIPVVVSMGSLAASGGYWIATAANEIWATPTTLTGSIGVFGILPTFEESLKALGVSSDGVGTTSLADFYHLNRPLTPQAKDIIQLSVNDIYQRFLALVAEARNSTPEAIHQIAQGRVWSGEKAQELGLVDKLGSLEQAIEAAAGHAKVTNYRVETIREPLGFHEQLLEALSQGGVSINLLEQAQLWLPKPLQPAATQINNSVNLLSKMNDPRMLYLQCFECTNAYR